MKIESLQKLYEEELKDLHSMERQIIAALPGMIRGATDAKLKSGLTEHLEVTKQQLARLDEIFAALGKSGKGKKCKGMEGVLEEGKELLQEDAAPEVKDAGIIAAAQHVEHYEMAGYGTVAAYAARRYPASAAGHVEALETGAGMLLIGGLALAACGLPAFI